MPLGPVQEKAIFGVYGAFLDDEIFAKIQSKGTVAKTGGTENLPNFEATGMRRTGKILCCKV